MSEIMNELYYMITERIGQQSMQDKELTLLMARKCALTDEIIFRIGEDGEALLDAMAELDSKINKKKKKALFHEALHLGTRISFS